MAAARIAPGWTTLVASVKAIAITVGSDLDEIWLGLETGRKEWVAATTATHTLKRSLKVFTTFQLGLDFGRFPQRWFKLLTVFF